MTTRDLQDKITIKTLSFTIDSSGGRVPTYTALESPWVKAEPLGGSESFEGDKSTVTRKYRFTGHYRNDFNETALITYRGNDYQIKSKQMSQERERWIVIEAEQRTEALATNNVGGSLATITLEAFSGSVSSTYDFANALEFDGINDYVTVASGATITNDITMSIWFKTSNFSNTVLWARTPQNQDIRFNSDTEVRVSWNTRLTFNVAQMGTGWNHLMATRSGSDTRVYVNGVESTSGAQNCGTDPVTVTHIGRWWNTSNHFDGVIDDFFVRDGSVGTLQNAVDLYNSGNGADPETILGSPVNWWKFNESTGLTASDSGTGADDGALNNFPGDNSQWVAH